MLLVCCITHQGELGGLAYTLTQLKIAYFITRVTLVSNFTTQIRPEDKYIRNTLTLVFPGINYVNFLPLHP